LIKVHTFGAGPEFGEPIWKISPLRHSACCQCNPKLFSVSYTVLFISVTPHAVSPAIMRPHEAHVKSGGPRVALPAWGMGGRAHVLAGSAHARPGAVQHRSTAAPSAEDDSDKPPVNSDLPQRPRMTSPPGVRIEGLTALQAAITYTVMSTDREVDHLFRQYRRILQTSGRWLEPPEKVQHQSAATAPAEISLRTIVYEPLTCASDLHRPHCP
jgi:hypothetical protein